MPHLVLMSRPFPLPPLQASGAPIDARYLKPGAVAPEGARVYCCAASDPVPASLIESFPASLGLIANLGVGTDNIDFDAARKRGLIITNTPVVTEDTADLAFALILAACRRVGQNERFVRAGGWSMVNPQGAFGTSAHGKTIGIIGFGDIGQAVARRAGGFGMSILYHGPNRKMDEEARYAATYVADLGDLLAISDIVTLHCPLTSATRHILNVDAIAKIKPGAIVVNAGRGALIDERALVAALASGHVSAAGLDVFESEPAISAELMAFEQAVLTPHIGSATVECRTAIMRRGIANIIGFLETGKVMDRVT